MVWVLRHYAGGGSDGIDRALYGVYSSRRAAERAHEIMIAKHLRSLSAGRAGGGPQLILDSYEVEDLADVEATR